MSHPKEYYIVFLVVFSLYLGVNVQLSYVICMFVPMQCTYCPIWKLIISKGTILIYHYWKNVLTIDKQVKKNIYDSVFGKRVLTYQEIWGK